MNINLTYLILTENHLGHRLCYFPSVNLHFPEGNDDIKNTTKINTPLPIYHHYKISSHYQVNNKSLVTNKVRIPGVTRSMREDFYY